MEGTTFDVAREAAGHGGVDPSLALLRLTDGLATAQAAMRGAAGCVAALAESPTEPEPEALWFVACGLFRAATEAREAVEGAAHDQG